MPSLDSKIAVHHLVAKNGARPIKQAQRRFRMDSVPLIKIEVNKLIEAGFIREVKYSTWVSSIVPVRKKNVFSIQKLKHYFQAHVVRLVSRANPIKFMMSKPILSYRLPRWYLQFKQFKIVYIPKKSIKGQALTDFLEDHPIPNDWELTDELPDEDTMVIEVKPPWKMYFDGDAHCGGAGAGAGVVFVTSQGEVLPYFFTLMQLCSKNVAKYQALILGLEMAIKMKRLQLQVFSDSQLVINQLLGSYEVKKLELRPYHDYTKKLMGWVGDVNSICAKERKQKD
ncbi:uncharacterized protein [Nicotiana sylvestris]|uniref:uncharacterized protein n=1 Tax=Nicotiana sylvestris TaxID=4096 RepID=UPI00388C8953